MSDLVAKLSVDYCGVLNTESKKASGFSVFSVSVGRKYYKIVEKFNGVSNSVHAFVDKVTGDVYKPASWNAPAKGIRYNLVNDFDTVAKRADIFGSYLYSR